MLTSHLSPALRAVAVEARHEGARSAYQMLVELVEETRTVLDAAKSQGAAGLTLQAIARCESLIEKLAKISGELNERPQVAVVNVQSSQEWVDLRTMILATLAAYPYARGAVVEALARQELTS